MRALHFIGADLDAQDVAFRADILAGFDRLLESHARFGEYLQKHRPPSSSDPHPIDAGPELDGRQA